MYQNIAQQNPMITKFNGYLAQNPNTTPFQSNQLINNNVHVMSHLTDFVQDHRNLQQNIPQYQQQLNQQQSTQSTLSTLSTLSAERLVDPRIRDSGSTINAKPNLRSNPKASTKSKINIIEEMLKPQKISKDNNKDVSSNFKAREKIQTDAMNGEVNIKMTNVPYKCIIKDKIVTKAVIDVKVEDLLVHLVNKEIDADVDKFNLELAIKEEEEEKINDEIKIEFHIDNYDTHKKKFEYKETFIRNMRYEENTFDENKQDYIEFYKQRQRDTFEGQKVCDEILRNFTDNEIISNDELPTSGQNMKDDIDLNNIKINDDSTTDIQIEKIPTDNDNNNDNDNNTEPRSGDSGPTTINKKNDSKNSSSNTKLSSRTNNMHPMVRRSAHGQTQTQSQTLTTKLSSNSQLGRSSMQKK